jgi:hypothetical protein
MVSSSRRPTSSRPATPIETPAERRDIVRRVAGPARDDLGRVVVEDQHRRLSRHARQFAVDELVGQQVAEDDHALAGEVVDERQQAAGVDRRANRERWAARSHD